jgi:hypothetical protein
MGRAPKRKEREKVQQVEFSLATFFEADSTIRFLKNSPPGGGWGYPEME